jgi:hypothetical protein
LMISVRLQNAIEFGAGAQGARRLPRLVGVQHDVRDVDVVYGFLHRVINGSSNLPIFVNLSTVCGWVHLKEMAPVGVRGQVRLRGALNAGEIGDHGEHDSVLAARVYAGYIDPVACGQRLWLSITVKTDHNRRAKVIAVGGNAVKDGKPGGVLEEQMKQISMHDRGRSSAAVHTGAEAGRAIPMNAVGRCDVHDRLAIVILEENMKLAQEGCYRHRGAVIGVVSGVPDGKLLPICSLGVHDAVPTMVHGHYVQLVPMHDAVRLVIDIDAQVLRIGPIRQNRCSLLLKTMA